MPRASRSLDVTRLAQAASRPGVDPRTWVVFVEVVELAYGAAEGLIVVGRVLGGALAGEEVMCEYAPPLARAGALVSLPFAVGDTGVCVVSEGDANVPPALVGFLRMETGPAPATVNGRAIDLKLISGAYLLVDPARELELTLGNTRLVAPTIKLGPTESPTQPYVRGKALQSALGAFCDALGIFCQGLGDLSSATAASCTAPPLSPLAGFFTGLCTLLAGQPPTPPAPVVITGGLGGAARTLKSHLVAGDVLSTKITGE